MIRVADVVANYVYETLGVGHVFAVTGAGIMHLTDALAAHSSLKTIFPHHEQSSSMAADTYSRYSGKIGVSMYSTGPAATNAITGLAGCWQDSVASIFISGQVKRIESSRYVGQPELRQLGVQELDILPIVESITKYCVQISDPNRVLYELQKATYLAANGRPGPVWVEVPLDVQAAYVRPEDLEQFSPPVSRMAVALEERFGLILERLSLSKRPVIIAGHGCRLAGVSEKLSQLAEDLDIPVASPYLGLDVIPADSDSAMGAIGIKGSRLGNLAVHHADFLLVLGSSMHISVIGYDYAKFSPNSFKAIVDADMTAHKKATIHFDEMIEADLGDFIDYWLESGHQKSESWTGWIGSLNEIKQDLSITAEITRNNDESSIYNFLAALNPFLQRGDCVIADAGSAFYAVSQSIRIPRQGVRYIPSGAMATMGYSVPASIGAWFAGAERVIAITGDGSFHQNSQELSLISALRPNVKLVVFNNDGYLSIRNSQTNFFGGREIGTDCSNGVALADIGRLAEAYGIDHMRVSGRIEASTLSRALGSTGPVLIEVDCPRDEKIVPTLSSELLPDGTMVSPGLNEMSPPLEHEMQSRIERLLNR